MQRAPTHEVNIYMSGPLAEAAQAIRAECKRKGLCVTLTPTTYIYTGGEEVGFIVGLRNYPRFPSTPECLETRARALALDLIAATHQNSALVVSSEGTEWFTTRGAT